jgi:hypothetical protein
VGSLRCYWLEYATIESGFNHLLRYKKTPKPLSVKVIWGINEYVYHQTQQRAQFTTQLNQINIEFQISDFLIGIPES